MRYDLFDRALCAGREELKPPFIIAVNPGEIAQNVWTAWKTRSGAIGESAGAECARVLTLGALVCLGYLFFREGRAAAGAECSMSKSGNVDAVSRT